MKDHDLEQTQVVENVGEIVDCYHAPGAVTKEILVVGQGSLKPQLGSLCRIKYIAYFYDKEMFDRTQDGLTLDLYLGDLKYIEGLWRGIQNMR